MKETSTILGFTPLMYAAEIGDAQCMKDLIDNGAVVDLQVECSF